MFMVFVFVGVRALCDSACELYIAYINNIISVLFS